MVLSREPDKKVSSTGDIHSVTTLHIPYKCITTQVIHNSITTVICVTASKVTCIFAFSSFIVIFSVTVPRDSDKLGWPLLNV